MCRNMLLICFITWCGAFGTAQKRAMEYDDLKKEYSHFLENDTAALPFITKSISSAKKSQNFTHLLHAYEDAAFATPDRLQKLKYADSCIQAAQQTHDQTLMSMAYLGKGIVYYFNFRQFDQALHYYLLAAKNAEHTDNDYLKYKIKYQIGVVKSYTGYTAAALTYFEACLLFFEKNLASNLHAHLRYNNTRGYLNTVHQMSICERKLAHLDQAEKLLAKAQPFLSNPDYLQEKGYYLKEKGILAFENKAYPEAIDTLRAAENLLQQKKEEHHLLVTNFYLGTAYLQMKEWEKSFAHLKKVDSLFGRNESISSEVIKTYELLLTNNNFRPSNEERNHYIDQLLKAERILQADMPNLSMRIQREYDEKNLLAEKAKLQKDHDQQHTLLHLFMGIASAVTLFVIIIWLRHRTINKRYHQLQEKLAKGDLPLPEPQVQHGRKLVYADEIVIDLLKKLADFEKTALFLEPDFNFDQMIKLFNTNKNHLSYVLNEHRQMSFYHYRASLRIRYITHLMNNDPQYLKLKMESLAETCGMSSRQQFNKFFKKFNLITPSEYIEIRKKELKIP